MSDDVAKLSRGGLYCHYVSTRQILNKYENEMLDSQALLSLAIYEYFSIRDIANQSNTLYEQYIISANTWKKLKFIASRIHSELVWMCVLTTEYCEIGERYQINLEKGRTYPLKRNALFIKMWYDYFALAIRENVKMVSTRVGIFHASRCCSIMIA